MGVVTVSSSAARSTPLGLNARYLTRVSPLRRPVILSFKKDKNKNIALIAPIESVVPLEANKENKTRLRKVKKRVERVNAVSTDEASPSTLDLDYSEAAAKLEYIFKQSPATAIPADEVKDRRIKRRQPRTKRTVETKEAEKKTVDNVVRSQRTKERRLNLERRIALRAMKEGEFCASSQKRRHRGNSEDEKIDRLVRDYSGSASDLVSIDWKKMKIPPVLPSSEHTWLFKLMQPMKVNTLSIIKVTVQMHRKLENSENRKCDFFPYLFLLLLLFNFF